MTRISIDYKAYRAGSDTGLKRALARHTRACTAYALDPTKEHEREMIYSRKLLFSGIDRRVTRKGGITVKG